MDVGALHGGGYVLVVVPPAPTRIPPSRTTAVCDGDEIEGLGALL